MAKKPKPRPLPKGSHKATPLASLAVREILRARKQQEVLKRRIAMLKALIIREGGGTAHGYRTFVSHLSGGTYHRVVVKKPSDELKMVKIK